MKNIFNYTRRWLSTNAKKMLYNTVISASILSLTCYAVQDGVFENYGSTQTCLFSVLMCNVWSGIFNVLGLFSSERGYILDDLSKFLTVRTYILSNVIIQLFLCLAEAVVTACILRVFFEYETTGVVFGNKSLDYLVTFFLVLFSADMLGLFVGMLIRSINSIMSAVPFVLVIQLLFSGCLFELNESLNKLAYITSARWGYFSLGSLADLNSFLPAEYAIDNFKVESGYILYCWRYLILLSLLFIAFSGITLYHQINKKED